MSTFLITGGAGFIGSHLTEAALALGHRVLVMDDLSSGSIENLANVRQHKGFEFAPESVTEKRVLAELVDRADMIFHLAATVGVFNIIDSPVTTILNNIGGTVQADGGNLVISGSVAGTALIAGSSELMHRARMEKHRMGGAMRQAGIVAAAGIYALDHNVERLAEDHARAKRLAQGLAAAGLPVDVDATETNFVGIDVASIAMDVADAQARIRAEGVLVGRLRPGVLRVATHLGVRDDDVDRAIELIPGALGVLAAA